MSKKIVVVIGSPRHNGNTEIMADAFVQGAMESGNQVTVYKLSEMKVNGCHGCDYCSMHQGECVQKDEMQKIYPALYEADMLVFASPLYYYGFSSQIKAMIDRLYATIANPLKLNECMLLADSYDDDFAVFEPMLVNYKVICKYQHWEDRGILTLSGVKKKGAMANHPRLAEARQLGLSIT